MTVHLTIPIDEASLERARAEAATRGLTVEAYVAQLVRRWLPPVPKGKKGHVSSIFGLVKEGEPTDIAKDKDRMLDEAAWEEYLEETGRK
jgi:hypothetical protein